MSSSVVGTVWDALLLLDAELLGIWDNFGGTPSLSPNKIISLR
jgi:hypothetical protein